VFAKTAKTTPKEITVKNAKLVSGEILILKKMNHAYHVNVIWNILTENVIREQVNAAVIKILAVLNATHVLQNCFIIQSVIENSLIFHQI
jgi:hypothetical protein